MVDIPPSFPVVQSSLNKELHPSGCWILEALEIVPASDKL